MEGQRAAAQLRPGTLRCAAQPPTVGQHCCPASATLLGSLQGVLIDHARAALQGA